MQTRSVRRLFRAILFCALVPPCVAQEIQFTPEQQAQLREVQELDKKLQNLQSQGRLREAAETGDRLLAILERVLGDKHPEVLATLSNVASLHNDAGDIATAEKRLTRCLALREKHRGPEHPDTANSLEKLAIIYRKTNRHALAESYIKRALKINESHFGSNSEAVARNLNTLAVLYETLKRPGDAEPLLNRALSIRESLYGTENPLIANILVNLGNVYVIMNRIPEAELTYKRARLIREKTIGADHPDTGMVISSLGMLYLRQRRYELAEPLLLKCSQILRDSLGPEHPESVAGLVNLGRLYSAQGKHSDTEAYYERALKICEEKLDPGHPYRVVTISYVARWYSQRGRLLPAEALYKRALQCQEQAFGENHPETALCLNRLAEFYIEQNDFTAAEPLCRRSMEICDAIGDGESLTAAACLNSLGLITAGRGDYQEGADLCRKAMKILETHPDDGQESMAGVLGNLAGILHDQGIFAEADALYGRALEIIEAQLGSEDPGIAPMLNGLALLRQDQGNYAAAEELFERSLRLRESVAGADDPAVALGLNNLAVIKKIRGDFAAAELLYRRAVKILESVFGPEHLLTAYGMNNLAAYYDAVGRAPEAEPLYQRALDIREAVMGAEHPLTLYTMSSLAAVHAARGKSDTASVLFRRSLSGLEKSLGPNHPHVINCLDGLAALMAESGSSEVLGMFDRSRQGAFRHARQSLGSLTESEQRLFLKNRFQPSFHAALLYTLQNRGSAADVSVSAAWVANCKGLVQEVLADRSLRLRDSSDAKAGPLLRDLETVERQLARLAMESPSATDFVRQGERVLELSQRANRLSKELALIAGTARESTAWVTTNELQGGIPAGAALIDIARVESTPMSGERADKGQSSPRYAAWITQSEAAGEPVLVDLGDAAEIESILAAIRKSIQSDGAVDGRIRQEGEPAAMQQLNVAMVQLSERIWAPIAPHLEDVSSILLSPDGQLWLAPWAALPVGDSQDPLIRRYSIRFLIRGSDLLAKRKTGANSGNPVIFADPNFNSSESEKRAAIEEVLREVPEVEAEAYGDTLRGYSSTGLLPLVLPLPNTALEAQLIAPKIEKMVSVKPAVYQTKFALESVAKSLKRPGMAIFATHGFFLPAPGTNDTESPVGASSDRSEGNAMAGGGSVLENPLLRCGLLLAGCNQRAVKVGDDDGVLTGLEITAIDFRGTDMVVLSACETGVGDVRIGEGVAGLRQAFQLAGARTVVATLWQIPDRDSAIIMNDFFENVARGETASEAMRQAQLKRIDARTNRYGAAHPLFWAAWTVTE